MKRSIRTFPLLIAVLGGTFTLSFAGNPPKISHVRITIELASPKQPIRVHSYNVFKITISNTAEFPLFIGKDLDFGTTVFIQNASKKEISPKVIGDLCPPPPPRPGENIWMEIGPGKSVSTLYGRSMDDLGIPKPGRYFATAYYFRYLTRNPEHDFPSLRDKPLMSEPIEFIVQ